MVPNGSAYANFPSFANNGTKTPPGGSTESAKYALGMVPADTFPAEWANYFFHGATAGITRLNSDTGSIKKEINTVLACVNITPDAESCSQLYCALTKIRDEAVALAYPVGTVYMNAKCATLPDALQAIGTWCAIDGRFLRACASRIGCTGGGSVTLEVCHLPSHCHTTPAHCHSGFNHSHSIDFFSCSQCSATSSGITTVWSGGKAYKGTSTSCVSASTGEMSGSTTADVRILPYSICTAGRFGQRCNIITGSGDNLDLHSQASSCSLCLNLSHSHTITDHYHTMGTHYHRVCGSTSTTGSSCNTGSACPTTCNTGSGCAFDIIPSYRDVAMWYRDA